MRLILVIVWLAIASCPVFSQKIEDGWKGLLPLRTAREDAEKILGKPERFDDLGHYYAYRTEEAFLTVVYTTNTCDQFGEYNVPVNTILRYDVYPERVIPLDDLVFDRTKYSRDKSGDFRTEVYYWEYMGNTMKSSNLFGTNIAVNINREGKESLRALHYNPRYEDAQKLLCRNSSKNTQ